MASALTLFGIALALMPLGLEAIGYELSHKQGYAILGLTALFVIAGIVAFFWPWIRGAWSWLRRDDALRKAERERDEARSTLTSLEQRLGEFGVKLTGDLDKQIAKTKQLTNELRNGRLQEENRELKGELRQTKQELEVLRAGERQKRIEKWRAEILSHHFQRHPLGGSYFAQTET